MKFYHGTTRERWKLIRKECVLWGGDRWHRTNGKEGYRYTYLTPDIKVALGLRPDDKDALILEVEYEPVGNKRRVNGQVVDNYGFNPPPGQYCWQFSVFVPIPLSSVRIVCEDTEGCQSGQLDEARYRT